MSPIFDKHRELSAIRQKIKRAEKHISDFQTGLRAYIDSRPYDVRIDVETDPGNPIVDVFRVDPIPPELLTVLGDAIHNLRSALDYLACSLVRANGEKPGPRTEFPILEGPITTEKREARFLAKVQGMRKEVIEAIRDINPYKGGDNTLWRLHRFDIIDKHNMLVAAWGSITAINGLPPVSDQWNGNRWVGVPGVPLTLKQGQKFRLPDAKLGKDTKFFAEIVFNEPDVAEGYPIILALRQFRTRVMTIIGNLSWGLNK